MMPTDPINDPPDPPARRLSGVPRMWLQSVENQSIGSTPDAPENLPESEVAHWVRKLKALDLDESPASNEVLDQGEDDLFEEVARRILEDGDVS